MATKRPAPRLAQRPLIRREPRCGATPWLPPKVPGSASRGLAHGVASHSTGSALGTGTPCVSDGAGVQRCFMVWAPLTQAVGIVSNECDRSGPTTLDRGLRESPTKGNGSRALHNVHTTRLFQWVPLPGLAMSAGYKGKRAASKHGEALYSVAKHRTDASAATLALPLLGQGNGAAAAGASGAGREGQGAAAGLQQSMGQAQQGWPCCARRRRCESEERATSRCLSWRT